MSTKPDIKLVAWVKGDNEYHERGEATVSEQVAALIAEGGEIRETAFFVDGDGRFTLSVLKPGSYLVYGPLSETPEVPT